MYIIGTDEDFISLISHETKKDIKIIENDQSFLEKFKKNKQIIIIIDNPKKREKLYHLYSKHKTLNYIPKEFSKNNISKINFPNNKAIVINKNVIIGSKVKISDGVKLNSDVRVHHHVVISKFSVIAPGARVLGGSRIGSCCYIGSNSLILNNIKICNDVIIGAGAVVTKDIIKKGTYVGCPAKKIK